MQFVSRIDIRVYCRSHFATQCWRHCILKHFYCHIFGISKRCTCRFVLWSRSRATSSSRTERGVRFIEWHFRSNPNFDVWYGDKTWWLYSYFVIHNVHFSLLVSSFHNPCCALSLLRFTFRANEASTLDVLCHYSRFNVVHNVFASLVAMTLHGLGAYKMSEWLDPTHGGPQKRYCVENNLHRLYPKPAMQCIWWAVLLQLWQSSKLVNWFNACIDTYALPDTCTYMYRLCNTRHN